MNDGSIMVMTPFAGGRATELSNRLWRKRLLPVGRIAYNGRMISFDRRYLADIAEAFRQRAYDQVPLQLAGADNRHTNDPERYAGQIVDLNLADDGLYITLEATERGNRVLSENPGLGVSARIVEGYDRADGRHFPAALQHVLATLDPKVPALGPWSVIEASGGGHPIVIDLSGSAFEGDEPPTASPSPYQQAMAGLAPPDATPQEIDALLDVLEEVKSEDALLTRWAEGIDAPSQPRQRRRQAGEAELAQFAAVQEAIELSSALDELRVIEDSEPLPRLSEDRLARAATRISQGSYTPADPPGYAPNRLHPGHPGPLTREPNCGPSDDLGYCTSMHHTMNCGSLSTSEMAETVRETVRSSAYQPLVNQQTGQPFTDQFGRAATLRDAVEASMGERIGGRESPFEGHPRRELVAIQRHVVHGDPDDPDGDIPMPDATRRTATTLAAHLGLAGPDVRAQRERARAQRDRALAVQQLARGGRRALGTGETMQERAARLSKPAVSELVMVEPGVSGSLPVYRRAS